MTLYCMLCSFGCCFYSDLDVREVREIPKLILSQLRWLDYLVNGKVRLLTFVTNEVFLLTTVSLCLGAV